ncbi:MAG: electron transfer flavoprotein subunit beta/FixA family protein [Anaerolineae bacterium]|nr:electron transfer flavoprotein subunit beta/FixA family protein [Anaerolineae bacterium]
MKILVLIKYSYDVAEIKVDPSSKELRLAGVPEKIGNIDKNAVEAAIRLRDAQGGGTVQVLCLGPEAAREGFRDVLAMGVDDATLVVENADGVKEAAAVVHVLEAAIKKMGSFDLIVCGFASDDGYTYQVAPRLAERLGMPLVSYVRQISLVDGKLKADRDLDEGLQTVAAPLPAVISVAEEAFPPRRTTLMDAIKAKKKPVNVWSMEADLGLNSDQLQQFNSLLSSSQVGIVVHRKQNVFKGKPAAELADQLIDALLEEAVLKGAA